MTVIAALALQTVCAGALRSWRNAALLSSGIAMAFAAPWLILAVGVVLAFWWLGVNALRRRAGQGRMAVSADRAADLIRDFSIAFVVIAAIPVVNWGITAAAVERAPQPPVAEIANQPDVVVLLLDGYPRADALMEQFDYDNRPFENGLAARGFDVAEESLSNYTATWATIASLTNMRYLDDVETLSPFPADPADQYRRLMVAINEGPAITELRSRGYEIVTIPSPFESAALVSADRYVDGGHLTSFELSLVQHSLIGRAVLALVPELFFDAHRARIEGGFNDLAAVLEEPKVRSRFVFAHLLVPHAPTVFNADGSPAPPMTCFPGCSPWAFTEIPQWRSFTPQVEHVNALVLSTIDRIVAADPGAVVIVMSDHGSREPGHDESNLFRSLFAARTPGWDGGPRDSSPVNLFPQLFNHYFGTDLELRPYCSWISAFAAPLTLTPVSGMDCH
jgi:hypothetical protein